MRWLPRHQNISPISSIEVCVLGRMTSSKSRAVSASIKVRSCVAASPASSFETVAWRVPMRSASVPCVRSFCRLVRRTAAPSCLVVRAMVSMDLIYAIAYKSSIYAFAYNIEIYAIEHKSQVYAFAYKSPKSWLHSLTARKSSGTLREQTWGTKLVNEMLPDFPTAAQQQHNSP